MVSFKYSLEKKTTLNVDCVQKWKTWKKIFFFWLQYEINESVLLTVELSSLYIDAHITSNNSLKKEPP